MLKMKSFFNVVFAVVVTLGLTGAAQAGHHGDKKDIVDVAAGNADFSTLVAAVKAAGLVDALKGDGPPFIF